MIPLLVWLLSYFTIQEIPPSSEKSRINLPDKYVFIKGGTFYNCSPEQDPYFYGYTRNKRKQDSTELIQMEGFYMSKFEVTNAEYREFLNEITPSLSAEEITYYRPDSTGWDIVTLFYNDPGIPPYFRHPAFNNYPVVNISHDAALKYCSWLQKKLQEQNPGAMIEVRLPEKYEWTWAATGGDQPAVYPWRGFGLRNDKKEYRCNFRNIGDAEVVRDTNTGKAVVNDWYSRSVSDNIFYIAPVKSFEPNAFNLYNMCGNVSKMIKEKEIAMGGSWNDYGGDVNIWAESRYKGPMATTGFRPVIVVKDPTRSDK
ncbi:MAG: SUMF1/EgtB/PvdO family nonheme iron enzyme [Bacteroidetes bacterium]|nr:SUMF1/EgtB/PvdO family nonheme iron enzyme [Bacteroidota bacterium]